MAKVDVVIPCYNYGRFLTDCVGSVLGQSLRDVRVLIIDDASSDDSVEVANHLAALDRRVEVVAHARNQGHISTYNEGIAWAQGDYFLLLSADDLLAPGALERAAAVMDSDPCIGLTYGESAVWLHDSPPPIIEPEPMWEWSVRNLLVDLCRTASNFIPTPTAIARTCVQKAVGGYRASLPHSGDLEMWLRFAAYAGVARIDTVQAIYRKHSTAMSNSYIAEMLRDYEQRKAAFDSFFECYGDRLPNLSALRKQVSHSLADQSFQWGIEYLRRGRIDDGLALLRWAMSLDRRFRYCPPVWRLLRLPGPEGCTRMLAAARTMVARLRRRNASERLRHDSDFKNAGTGVPDRSGSGPVAKTVLFISHEASRTGAPIMLLNFLRWFRQEQRIAFRTLTGSVGELSADFAAAGPASSVEPSGALWYRAMRRLNLHHDLQSRHLRRLHQQLRNDDIGLIYVNSVASGRMLDLLPVFDCPVICHVHELAGAIRSVGVENIAALERRRPRYIAVSHAVKNCLASEFGIPKDRIEVIHGFVPDNPHEMPSAEQARKQIARELNLAAAAKLVCGCGSIEARKGTDLFLEVARRVADSDREAPVHFVWVGGSPDKVAAMRRQAKNAGLEAKVHFVGHKPSTQAYFAASDVFLLTSREDPFPLVIMEAARCGKPIVCFGDGGGAPEFVLPDAGFCVPDFDVAAMGRSVSDLLFSPALRERMGRAAKRKVATRHNLEQGAARITTRIRDALQVGAQVDRQVEWACAETGSELSAIGQGSEFAT